MCAGVISFPAFRSAHVISSVVSPTLSLPSTSKLSVLLFLLHLPFQNSIHLVFLLLGILTVATNWTVVKFSLVTSLTLANEPVAKERIASRYA